LSDEGKIRVGLKYQAEIPALLILKKNEEIQDRDEIIWNCNDCKLNDDEFKKFKLVTQSIGTYARALDCNNNDTNQKPNLILSASNASRDITLFNSYKYLHESKYNLTKALLNFIPSNGNGPILCKDEIENWSQYEMNLFEEGLDKYGKNFLEIKNELLSFKTLSSIIEYYYLWKTTDRYVPRKRIKETQDRKLNQVYIPN
jgi:metastasis-associated protein MTA